YPDKDDGKNILKVEDGEEGRKRGSGTDGADAPLDLRDDQADPKGDGGHDSGSTPSEDASADGQAQQYGQGQAGDDADSDPHQDTMPQPTEEPKTGEEKPDGFDVDKINVIDDKDRANILGKAKGWEDTPYAPADSEQRGPNATKKVGADCSGSIHAIYKEAGLGYKYKSSSEFAGAARRGEIPFKEVPAKDSKPGDIVLWPGKHMTLNQGSGMGLGARRRGEVFGSVPISSFTRDLKQEPIYFTRTR
ncbi:MAG: hypothetical protein HZA67_14545, partial [Rhodospirillales bacterium]|nr:hypothetical protein [Rhodospirillales bacterium]